MAASGGDGTALNGKAILSAAMRAFRDEMPAAAVLTDIKDTARVLAPAYNTASGSLNIVEAHKLARAPKHESLAATEISRQQFFQSVQEMQAHRAHITAQPESRETQAGLEKTQAWIHERSDSEKDRVSTEINRLDVCRVLDPEHQAVLNDLKNRSPLMGFMQAPGYQAGTIRSL
jgi:hypothetical protein